MRKLYTLPLFNQNDTRLAKNPLKIILELMSDNKVVFITGCSSGIGRACALALEESGFRIIAGVRNKEEGERVESLLSNSARFVCLDVTSNESVTEAIEEVEKISGTGGLFGLLNNIATSDYSPVEAMDIDRFRQTLEINFFGTMQITKGFIPHLRASKGRIVTINSIGEEEPHPFSLPVYASRQSLSSFTQVLALELAPWEIDVISILPTYITNKRSFRMMDKVHENLSRFSPQLDALYKDSFLEGGKDLSNQMAKRGVSPEVVGRAAVLALTEKSPKQVYTPGPKLFKFPKMPWKKAS